MIIAPLPKRLIFRSTAEPVLMAALIVDKFTDHLPFCRSLDRINREGGNLSRATVNGGYMTIGRYLMPLGHLLHEEVLSGGYLQADETHLRVQDPKKKGTTHRTYHWVYYAPESRLVWMDYHKTRTPQAILNDFKDALLTDGYTVYDDFSGHPAAWLLGACAPQVRESPRLRSGPGLARDDADPARVHYPELRQFSKP